MPVKKKDESQQLDLIDVTPKNQKKFLAAARAYKEAVTNRCEWTAEETKYKKKILELVKEAELARLPDGTIKFKVDGMTITITPTDEKVNVKLPKDDEEAT